jgi:RNase P protein component
LPAGFDLVFRPRKGAQPDYHAIEASLRSLCRRAAGKHRSQR